MEYVWLWILGVLDMIWLITAIMDVKTTIEWVKENKKYDSMVKFIIYVAEELEGSTITFVIVHLAVLFIVSFVIWVHARLGSGVE